MVKVRLRITLDSNGSYVEPHQVRLYLSKWASQAEHIGGMFRAAYEVEMLQGRQTSYQNGSVVYRFQLNTEKAKALRAGLTHAYFQPGPN